MNAKRSPGVGRLCAILLLAVLPACGGGSSVGRAGSGTGDRVELLSVRFGRLVDIYSYRRLDVNRGDRRDRFNRQATLIARNVVIGPDIETEALFDASGEVVPSANYQYRAFDVDTGHEELMILWDDRPGVDPAESARFETALAAAKSAVVEVPAAFREQNTATHPIPLVPRNAALRLQFSGPLALDDDFFVLNPSALQLLEFKGDPRTVSPVEAFRAVPARILVDGDGIIVDTTILGREGGGGAIHSTGMPPSGDNFSANMRLAIPSRGAASPLFFVPQDPVPNLNGVDSFGRPSVIRDFRSGNLSDGRFGTLVDAEPPMIVANLEMGIMAIDSRPNEQVITLNKRFNLVPIRGRFPFVEGPYEAASTPGGPLGLPRGPSAVPTQVPLRSGDFLTQFVDVAMPGGGIERVRVRAEILENLGVGSTVGVENLGRTTGGGQGESSAIARVRVATVEAGTDSLGRPVSFQASPLPEGSNCSVRAHYYEDVPFQNGVGSVTDRFWRALFLVVEPKPPRLGPNQQPVQPGTMIAPASTLSIAFSEPMDLERVDNTHNLVITNATLNDTNFASLIRLPKPASLSVVPSRFTDQSLDGSQLQLSPQLGHFHQNGVEESYWFHVLLESTGVTDLAGNPVAVFGSALNPLRSWSVEYKIDPALANNLVGWITRRFEDVDEDGTPPGSVDAFGQFRIQDGRLMAAETIRFSRTADNQNLGGIARANRGECWLHPPGQQLPFVNPPPAGHFSTTPAGALYGEPRVYGVNPLPPQVFLPPNTPQDVGRIIEPHQPRGSRMMMRYLEDDFSLSYTVSSSFVLDVEQLYWSPFNDENVLFDVFDRYTMALSHSDKRPDLRFVKTFPPPPPPPAPPPVPPPPPNGCAGSCNSMNSSLSLTFADNVLVGSTQTTVFEDKLYQINPNAAFRAPSGAKYVPYPKFDRSYTWRDSRLVTLDSGNVVIGLGGARDPGDGALIQNDWTADVDSPWITDQRPVPGLGQLAFPGSVWAVDNADFRGDRRRDHDPIALPLLVDFKIFPDDAFNGLARGVNAFQVAMIGPPRSVVPPYGAYYNQAGGSPCAGRPPWPWIRIHTTGGLDPNTGQNILVDPANTPVALGGWVKDAGLGDPIQGLFLAPPGDSHLHWAQADFVRRVSTVTFGFFDTLQPNRHGLTLQNLPSAGAWPGLGNANGFPDLAQASLGNLRVQDLVTSMDPPANRQPAGTTTVLELRGARTLVNATIYDRRVNDVFNVRGNLHNPNFACEAYRYSMTNSLPDGTGPGTSPRLETQGLTRYVTEDQLALIRDPVSGLLPRYLNLRLVMTNNVSVTPALSPSLRSLSLVYRMAISP